MILCFILNVSSLQSNLEAVDEAQTLIQFSFCTDDGSDSLCLPLWQSISGKFLRHVVPFKLFILVPYWWHDSWLTL
jgi:hypothetical protein